MRPKKINVRPANNLEGDPGSIVVWIYHRKVQVQLMYGPEAGVEWATNDAMDAWKNAMRRVENG